MDIIARNSEKSKAFDPHTSALNVADETGLKRSDIKKVI